MSQTRRFQEHSTSEQSQWQERDQKRYHQLPLAERFSTFSFIWPGRDRETEKNFLQVAQQSPLANRWWLPSSDSLERKQTWEVLPEMFSPLRGLRALREAARSEDPQERLRADIAFQFLKRQLSQSQVLPQISEADTFDQLCIQLTQSQDVTVDHPRLSVEKYFDFFEWVADLSTKRAKDVVFSELFLPPGEWELQGRRQRISPWDNTIGIDETSGKNQARLNPVAVALYSVVQPDNQDEHNSTIDEMIEMQTPLLFASFTAKDGNVEYCFGQLVDIPDPETGVVELSPVVSQLTVKPNRAAWIDQVIQRSPELVRLLFLATLPPRYQNSQMTYQQRTIPAHLLSIPEELVLLQSSKVSLNTAGIQEGTYVFPNGLGISPIMGTISLEADTFLAEEAEQE